MPHDCTLVSWVDGGAGPGVSARCVFCDLGQGPESQLAHLHVQGARHPLAKSISSLENPGWTALSKTENIAPTAPEA